MTWTDTSQKKTYKWPTNMKKCTFFTNDQRKANHNYNVIPSHTSQNNYYQKVSNNNRYGQDCEAKGMLINCWWECNLVQSLWKTMWWFLKDPKIPFKPAIPLLGMYSKDYTSFYYKDTCTHMFTAALFTTKTCNQPKCPSPVDWIKKSGTYIPLLWNPTEP